MDLMFPKNEIKTVRCHYADLDYILNKIGRDHIISITSYYIEHSNKHIFTIVYDTPGLVIREEI